MVDGVVHGNDLGKFLSVSVDFGARTRHAGGLARHSRGRCRKRPDDGRHAHDARIARREQLVSDSRKIDSLDDDSSEEGHIAELYENVKRSLKILNGASASTYTQQMAMAVTKAIQQLDTALADKDKRGMVRFKGFLDSLLQTIETDYEGQIDDSANQIDPDTLKKARKLIRDLRQLYTSL
jgi:hypothetical protein